MGYFTVLLIATALLAGRMAVYRLAWGGCAPGGGRTSPARGTLGLFAHRPNTPVRKTPDSRSPSLRPIVPVAARPSRAVNPSGWARRPESLS
jgi:hypothetical protein